MIRVMGAGAFGTALAIALTRNGPVTLWARDPAHAREMRMARANERRLRGVTLPEDLMVETGEIAAGNYQATLLAVPMQKLREFCIENKKQFGHEPLVVCCKGVELSTGRRATEIISEETAGAKTAILTGPSFASDIARGLPTALTLSSADQALGQDLQRLLNTPTLRLYRTTDVIGAELGGALKNVVAIACGVAMGAGLGESARAALMTRGFSEMSRVAQKMGARKETLSGLSGFGDLALTCSSNQSRNYRFGVNLGRDQPFDSDTTVEGAATAIAMRDKAKESQIDLPIMQAVADLITGQLKVDEAMDMLLSRPLKEETC